MIATGKKDQQGSIAVGDLADELRARDESAAVRSQNQIYALGRLGDQRRRGFQVAHQARLTKRNGESSLTQRLEECRRQRAGQYEANVLARIRETGGCQTFFNITGPRCESLVSWINEVIREKFFLITPTPIPDLSAAVMSQINQEVWSAIQSLDDQGAIQSEDDAQQKAQDLFGKLKTFQLRAERKEARRRSDAMQSKIEDQLEEGRFQAAWRDMIEHLATYPYAVMEGPLIRMVQRTKWSGDGELTVVDEAIPTFRAIDPFYFFPGVNMVDPNNGDLYLLEDYTRRELSGNKGQKGWIASELEAALARPAPVGEKAYLPEEVMKAAQEGRDTGINQGNPDGVLTCLRSYGTVSAQDLVDAGIDWAVDEDGYLDVNMLQVGPHVVYAAKNDDPLARRPYHVVSFNPVPGSFAGIALPEVMRAAQEGMASAVRDMINSGSLSSLPCGSVDANSVDPGCDPTEIRSGKMYPYDGAKLQFAGQKPVEYFFIPDNSEKALQRCEFFENQADNQTRIPRFVFGDGDVQGAGQTSSGLSMLMNSAAKGVKLVVGYLDQYIVEPVITMIYDWNMKFLPDDEWGWLKGDCRVAARGALTLMVQEIADQGLPQILQMFSQDPNLFAMIGMDGLAKLARQMLERKNMPGLDVVPDEDEMEERMQGSINAPLAPAPSPAGTPGAAPGMNGQAGGAGGGGDQGMPGAPGMVASGAPEQQAMMPPSGIPGMIPGRMPSANQPG